MSQETNKKYNVEDEYTYDDPATGAISTHKILRKIHSFDENWNMTKTPTHMELGPRISTTLGGGKRRRRRKSRSKSRKSRRKSRKTKRKRRKSRKTKKRRRRRR